MCKCFDRYGGLKDFELFVDDEDSSASVYIEESSGGVFLTLRLSSYTRGGLEKKKILYCPWCGEKL